MLQRLLVRAFGFVLEEEKRLSKGCLGSSGAYRSLVLLNEYSLEGSLGWLSNQKNARDFSRRGALLLARTPSRHASAGGPASGNPTELGR